MKIKRTLAPSVREAMNKVRQEQGADAVILANRKVRGGVEIISATDYDEKALELNPRETADDTSVAIDDNQAAADEDGVRTHISYKAVALGQNQETAVSDSVNTENSTTVRPYIDERSIRTESDACGVTDIPPHEKAGNDSRYSQPIVDISAARLPQPLRDPAWQQGQVIHDLQRELHSLRGLMENQLSVLEWDALARRKPIQFDLLSRLTEMGLAADTARALVDISEDFDDPEKAWRVTLGELARRIPIADADPLDEGGVVALVGPTGVGKTTSVAKLAARFVMRHGPRSVALISTDCYRIGAHEQLHNFARILGVPFKTADNHEELSSALGAFFDKKLILIDTAGMSQRDIRLSEQFSTLRDSFPVIHPYLVLAANTQLGAMDESVKGFGRVDLRGCIVTKLDETTSIGPAISVAIRHQLPLAYVGVGQRVPEDLQPARAHRLISRAVPMGERYAEEIDADSLAVRYGSGVAHAGV